MFDPNDNTEVKDRELNYLVQTNASDDGYFDTMMDAEQMKWELGIASSDATHPSQNSDMVNINGQNYKMDQEGSNSLVQTKNKDDYYDTITDYNQRIAEGTPDGHFN